MSVEFDTSELRQLAADLGSAGARASGAVRATTQKAALNIKQQLQREASGREHAPRLPFAITYDTRELQSGIIAEIGPRTGGPGSLAFYYYGNSKVGPQLPDPMGALDAEAPAYAKYLAEAVADEVLP